MREHLAMGEGLRIYLFGEPHFEYCGAAYSFAAPPKTLPLLAYLLLHRDAPAPRETIATALWAESDREEALANLRRHLHYLNKALPPAQPDKPWLISNARNVCWNSAAPYWLDVELFEAESQDRRFRPEAARLYSGDLYERCADEWIFYERERLRSLQMSNLAQLSAEARDRKAYLQALQYAQLMLALDPWREDALRLVLEIRGLLGDAAGAVSEYERFARRLKDELDVRPSDETAAVYQRLRDARVTASNAARDWGAPGVSPIAGRRNELAVLSEEWHRASQGRARLLLIGGEAGIGKTTLLETLAVSAAAEGAPVLKGTATSDAPYQPFLDVLRQADDAAFVLSDITASNEAASERLQFFDEIARMLRRAAAKPVLVLLEDLHLAGPATFDLLRYVFTRLPDAPILFAATYREYEIDRGHPLRAMRRQLAHAGYCTHLAVAPLDRESAYDLIRTRAHRAVDGATAARIYEATDGNPLFIVEVLHQYAQGGLENIPESVATIVRSRLERLDAPARTVAEIAAVAGRHVTVEHAAQISGLRESETLAALDKLVERHILRESAREELGQFTFVHDIVRKAVYDQIPGEQLRHRHARVGLALRDFHAPDISQGAGEIARHLELGGLFSEAANAYAIAAETALRLHALEEAQHCAVKVRELTGDSALRSRALLVLETIARSRGARDEQRRALNDLAQIAPGLPEDVQMEVVCRRAEFLTAVDDPEAEEALARMREQCELRPDLRARYLLVSGESLQRRGLHEPALNELREAIEIFRRRGDSQGSLASYTAWLNAVISAGRLHPGVIDEIQTPDDETDPRTCALLAHARGRALYNYDPAGSYAAGEEMLRAAQLADDRWLEALALRTMGASAAHLNRLSAAERHLQRSADLIVAAGRPYDLASVRMHQIQLVNRAGYYEAAYRFAEDGFNAARACRSVEMEVRMEVNLVDADMAACDVERALERAVPAFEKTVRFGLRGVQPAVMLTLGVLQIGLRDPGLGIQTLLESQRITESFGVSPWHVPPVLGLAWLCAGDRRQAQACAGQLRGRARELSKLFFIPQAYLWAGAHLFHFLGEDDDAQTFADAAYLRFQEMLATLEQGPMRASFVAYRFNRAIAALHERGLWAPDPLHSWFLPWNLDGMRSDDAPLTGAAHRDEQPYAGANRQIPRP